MGRTITISGTDPANPKTLGQVLEYLRGLERSLDKMADHAGWLQMFASPRDVLLDQRVSLRTAQERSDLVMARMRSLRASLEEAHQAAQVAQTAITQSGANLRESLVWRPGIPGRR